MTVEQTNVIDMIYTDKQTGALVLTISDHLEWSNSVEHQTVLQAKLNAYLAFVESGEVFQRYPDAKGRPVVIDIIFKFRPDQEGTWFLARAKDVIRAAGSELRHEVFAQSYDN